MKKVSTCLWFDKEAKEAAEFYASIFKDSKVKNIATLHNTPSPTPSGSVDIISFELLGQAFMAISAGPLFKFNPLISFHVKCRTKDEVDAIWEKLSKGGTVLMKLGEYRFSEKYGWIQDKYGLSWQMIFAGKNEIKQKITPVLMFVGSVCGKAEEAVNFYASVFHDAKVDNIVRYGNGEEPDKEGTVKYAAFALEGQEFGAYLSSMDMHQRLRVS
jgi:predicted 3-demethylubiquinone-9 3-methyltransferase (glyoxalase superfamily)